MRDHCKKKGCLSAHISKLEFRIYCPISASAPKIDYWSGCKCWIGFQKKGMVKSADVLCFHCVTMCPHLCDYFTSNTVLECVTSPQTFICTFSLQVSSTVFRGVERHRGRRASSIQHTQTQHPANCCLHADRLPGSLSVPPTGRQRSQHLHATVKRLISQALL